MELPKGLNPREVLPRHTKGKRQVLDVLRYWYTYPGTRKPILTEKQENIRRRLVGMYNLLCSGMSLASALRAHGDIFDLDESSCMVDYQRAVQLFGDITAVDRRGMRHIYSQMAHTLWEKAMLANDLATAGRALAIIDKMNELSKPDPEMEAYIDKMQPTAIIMALPPSQQERIEQLLSAGVVNFAGVSAPDRIRMDLDHIEEARIDEEE